MLLKIGIFTAITVSAYAETIALGRTDISDDTFIKRSAPTENFSKDAFLIVATNSGPNDESCSLLRFEIPEMSGFVVKRATLTLCSAFGTEGLDMTQNVYKATAAWSRDTATWDSDSSNYDSSDPDVSTTIFTPVGPEKNGTAFNFDVTAIVNAWHTKSAVNYGFFIQNEAGDKSLIGYYSSHLGYPTPPSPQLTIEYIQGSESGKPHAAPKK